MDTPKKLAMGQGIMACVCGAMHVFGATCSFQNTPYARITNNFNSNPACYVEQNMINEEPDGNRPYSQSPTYSGIYSVNASATVINSSIYTASPSPSAEAQEWEY